MLRDLRKLRDIDQNRAAAFALNEVRAGVRTDMKRRMSRRVPILKPPAKRRTASRLMSPKTGKANARNLTAVGLQLFKYVPKMWLFAGKKNVVGLGSGEFVQTMKSGHVGVWKRTGAASSDGKGKIKEVLTDQSNLSERQLDRALRRGERVLWPKAFRRGAARYIIRSWGV